MKWVPGGSTTAFPKPGAANSVIWHRPSTPWPNGSTGLLQSKEQLLLDVSHELRSPITRLKVQLEFLKDATCKNPCAVTWRRWKPW
jgi:hypothetical protein